MEGSKGLLRRLPGRPGSGLGELTSSRAAVRALHHLVVPTEREPLALRRRPRQARVARPAARYGCERGVANFSEQAVTEGGGLLKAPAAAAFHLEQAVIAQPFLRDRFLRQPIHIYLRVEILQRLRVKLGCYGLEDLLQLGPVLVEGLLVYRE
jgi:hypothetical protein